MERRKRRRRRFVLNSSRIFHHTMVRYWKHEEKTFMNTRRHRMRTRFDLIVAGPQAFGYSCMGDKIVEEMRDLFYNGFGIKWSEVQSEIFEINLQSLFPLLYGDDWPEHKARVLAECDLEKEEQFVLISMARRNGKTFVTAATAATVLLKVTDKNQRGCSLAVFSTGERTSRLLMGVVIDMLENAFNKGSHVNRQDYTLVQKNKESLVFEGPDSSKRTLACLPGSVRVSSVVVVVVVVVLLLLLLLFI